MRIATPLKATALMAAALIALTGCASSKTTAAAPDAPLETVKVGVIPVIGLIPHFVAIDQGFYEDHGLTVEQAPIPGGAALVPALESGELNIGGTNPVSPMQAVEQGLDVKCIGELTRKTEEGGLPLVLAPANDGVIKTGSDFEGKTVAVNTLANMHHIVAASWIRENGGDPSKVNFQAVDFADMIPALLEERVDAAMLDEPFGTIAAGQDIPVLDEAPFLAAIGEKPVMGCWVVSSEWAESHPREVEAFIAAIADAEAYLAGQEDDSEFRRILVDQLELDPALAESVILPEVISQASEDDYKAWQDEAVAFGFMNGPIDIANLMGDR